MGKQLIIAVSREFGSGGHEIADILAKKFNIPIYDNNLLTEIANSKNLDVDTLEKYDEKPKNIFLSRSVRGYSNSLSEVLAQMQFDYIRELDPHITVVSKACPLFVPLVEEGLIEDRVTDDIVSRYLQEMKEYNVDALVLGCTHYPLIRNAIKRFMGEQVHLVNPAFETAKVLKELLTDKEMLNMSGRRPSYEYYVSDGVESFMSFADSVLPFHVKDTEVIDIESY